METQHYFPKDIYHQQTNQKVQPICIQEETHLSTKQKKIGTPKVLPFRIKETTEAPQAEASKRNLYLHLTKKDKLTIQSSLTPSPFFLKFTDTISFNIGNLRFSLHPSPKRPFM